LDVADELLYFSYGDLDELEARGTGGHLAMNLGGGMPGGGLAGHRAYGY